MIRRRFSTGESEFNPDKYLTIEALEDGLQIFHANGFEYKTDNSGWQRAPQYELTTEINKGEFLYIRARWTSSFGISFNITRSCNLRGNCLSLLFGNNADKQHDISQFPSAFAYLFFQCPIKEVASDFLPATTLADSCYQYMFDGCTSLTSAPELPATILADNCYRYMFRGCTSLVNAPALPATTLADSCYQYMFDGCTSLTVAPELPATTLATSCYYSMFRGCKKLNYIKARFTTTPSSSYTFNWVSGVASSGTFVKNKNATWEVTGVNGVPSGWTIIKE